MCVNLILEPPGIPIGLGDGFGNLKRKKLDT